MNLVPWSDLKDHYSFNCFKLFLFYSIFSFFFWRQANLDWRAPGAWISKGNIMLHFIFLFWAAKFWRSKNMIPAFCFFFFVIKNNFTQKKWRMYFGCIIFFWNYYIRSSKFSSILFLGATVQGREIFLKIYFVYALIFSFLGIFHAAFKRTKTHYTVYEILDFSIDPLENDIYINIFKIKLVIYWLSLGLSDEQQLFILCIPNYTQTNELAY